jgi:hypothetical protein
VVAVAAKVLYLVCVEVAWVLELISAARFGRLLRTKDFLA